MLARVGLADLDPDRRAGTLGLGPSSSWRSRARSRRRCDVLLSTSRRPPSSRRDRGALRPDRPTFAAGRPIVLITHRLDEVARIADRVSVLRDGRLVATRPAADLGREEVVRLMVGRSLTEAPGRPAAPQGEVALRVRGPLRAPIPRRELRGAARRDPGSGRPDGRRPHGGPAGVFGADRATDGGSSWARRRKPADPLSRRTRCAHGLSSSPRIARARGCFSLCRCARNVTLGCLPIAWRAGLGCPTGAEEARLREVARTFGVARRPARVAQLSGGNQQKVLLGTRAAPRPRGPPGRRAHARRRRGGAGRGPPAAPGARRPGQGHRGRVLGARRALRPCATASWSSPAGGSLRPSAGASGRPRRSWRRQCRLPTTWTRGDVAHEAQPRRHGRRRPGRARPAAVVLAALVLAFSLATDRFFTGPTLRTIANQVPELVIAAVGLTFVLLIGAIDLSVGSVMASEQRRPGARPREARPGAGTPRRSSRSRWERPAAR